MHSETYLCAVTSLETSKLTAADVPPTNSAVKTKDKRIISAHNFCDSATSYKLLNVSKEEDDHEK